MNGSNAAGNDHFLQACTVKECTFPDLCKTAGKLAVHCAAAIECKRSNTGNAFRDLKLGHSGAVAERGVLNGGQTLRQNDLTAVQPASSMVPKR